MKACAFVLLVACSPSVALAPSSLPAVSIDRSLPGPVCSREAAEVIAALRSRERGDAAQKLVACQGETKAARAFGEQQMKRADAFAWWGKWGGIVALCAFVVGGAGGAVVAWGLSR